MIVRKLRVRSEVAQLGYISPWKLQQETNRDLENFLGKNQTHDETSSPAFRWTRTETFGNKHPKTEPSFSKKTARTAYSQPATDFKQAVQRTFNRKFYSKTVSLRRRSLPEYPDQPIFARRSRESQKPRLVTLGSNHTEVPARCQSHAEARAGRRKKEHMLRKQSMTQGILKHEMTTQKDFITSLQSCLAELERGKDQNQTVLTSTMKDFLSHYKKR